MYKCVLFVQLVDSHQQYQRQQQQVYQSFI